MNTILVAARSNRTEWAELFAAEFPDRTILLEPPGDATPVAYAVVGRPAPAFLHDLAGLKLLLSLNAGIEHLMIPGAVPAGVPIVRLVDEGLTHGMVDWVLAQTLAWHRNLFAYRADQQAGRWAPRPELLARERIVTVLGAGVLGRPVAELLAAIGFSTRVWSRTPKTIAGADGFAGRTRLEAAVDGAHILVNLLPLTPETENIIDARLLTRLAPGAFLVNGARGRHVVDADLLAALDAGSLGGAALDVFREEPLPPGHRFWTHAKIWMSPHVAAPTHARTAVAAMAASIRSFESGALLTARVDVARGY